MVDGLVLFYDELVSSDSREVKQMKRKRNWEHLDLTKRKILVNQLSLGKTCIEIGMLLGVDPTTVSKEVKRNRKLFDKGKILSTTKCDRLNRFPFVCNNCNKKYGRCDLERYVYEADEAQRMANTRLVHSRRGINMTPEEFDTLDRVIKEGVSQNESIYHIVESSPEIDCSVSSVYRYIDCDYLTTKPLDLPRKVKMKKRKNKNDNKKYDYSKDPINSSNRTYIDYLQYSNQNPGLYCIQMDFLGKIQTDSKSILTLTIPHLHFVFLFLLERESGENVVNVFNHLEGLLGFEDFKKVFPFILTDRDSCFKNFQAIESSALTHQNRTLLFYCDAFTSSQKANVENMNQQLRTYFPKKESKQHLTDEFVSAIMIKLNQRRVKSLSGATPIEAFCSVYGAEILDKLLTQ